MPGMYLPLPTTMLVNQLIYVLLKTGVEYVTMIIKNKKFWEELIAHFP
jgi:hypothetical protein